MGAAACTCTCFCGTAQRRTRSSAFRPTSGSVEQRLHARTKSGNTRPHDVRIRVSCERRVVREELHRHDRNDRAQERMDAGKSDGRSWALADRLESGTGLPERVHDRFRAATVLRTLEDDDRFGGVNRKERTVEELLHVVSAGGETARFPDLERRFERGDIVPSGREERDATFGGYPVCEPIDRVLARNRFS